MKTRIVMLAIALTLAACSYQRPPARVALPDTPEAKACSRTCEQTFETCYAGCPKPLIKLGTPCADRCAESWQSCLITCPGAK